MEVKIIHNHEIVEFQDHALKWCRITHSRQPRASNEHDYIEIGRCGYADHIQLSRRQLVQLFGILSRYYFTGSLRDRMTQEAPQSRDDTEDERTSRKDVELFLNGVRCWLERGFFDPKD